MAGLGQIKPPSFVAATAELASIADAAKARRRNADNGVGGRRPSWRNACVFLAGLHRPERTIAERPMRQANGALPRPWIDPD
jgi:hypothetical protein